MMNEQKDNQSEKSGCTPAQTSSPSDVPQKNHNPEAVVVILKTDKGFWLQMVRDENDKYSILAFDSISRGIHYFEGGYQECHQRSYESSMSACINYLFFQPAVVVFKSLEELIKTLFPDGKTPNLYSLNHISGYYKALPINKEIAEPLWEAGHKPKLIQ